MTFEQKLKEELLELLIDEYCMLKELLEDDKFNEYYKGKLDLLHKILTKWKKLIQEKGGKV